ncbi:MAG: AAA family ATPase [Gemmatimonadota bacterium]
MTRSLPAGARNPFEFGRELAPDELVDRDEELREISRVVANRGKLFLIGPRRYGKTSILNAVEHRLTAKGAVVLRYDAEAYESVAALAQALLTGTARKLTGPLAKAGEVIKQFFSRLRPDINYDLVHHTIEVKIGRVTEARATEVPLLTDVLDGIERLAAGRKKPVVVILDEFQQVVREGGEAAERQIRAAIQRHRHVSYLFAGSKTRLMADMTGDPGRAFWKLGERRFLGPVPRQDFRRFLARGFSRAGFRTTPEGVDHILDLAEDVPFNVQRLASACWERLRVRDDRSLTVAAVDEAARSVVSHESPAYTQIWTSLSRAQKMALKSVIEQGGRELLSRTALDGHGLAASTIQRALESLDTLGLVRQEEIEGGIRYRLEDPFFSIWLALAQEQ